MLARLLEARGLVTLSVSLVREHTAMLRPPRALYVPFPFGMPLGHPGDPVQQRRVLQALFALLDGPAPVLADLGGQDTDDEPASPVQASALVAHRPAADLAGEVSRLRHYQQTWLARTGRTSVGVTGIPVERFRGLVRFLEAVARGERPDPPGPRRDIDWAYFVRYAADDLKALYVEARFVMRPDDSQDQIQRWLWSSTALGPLLVSVSNQLCATDNPDEKAIAYGITR